MALYELYEEEPDVENELDSVAAAATITVDDAVENEVEKEVAVAAATWADVAKLAEPELELADDAELEPVSEDPDEPE